MPLEQEPPADSSDNPQALLAAARKAVSEGRLLDALHAYDRMAELEAADEHVWREMASALVEVGESAQSLGAFENSLALNPDSVETHNDLAKALYHLGDVESAAAHLRRAVELSDAPSMWLNLAVLLVGVPSATPEEILKVRTTYARRQAKFLAPARRSKRKKPPAGNGRLRVGYLSAFFHAANYMKPVWGLINHHDRRRFDLHLLSDSDPQKGMPGYQPHANDRVHATAGLDNRHLAARIEDLHLDILIDLNSYSVPRRLGLFFEPLSPVTVAWFNAFATSGLPGVPFLIGDEEVIRPDEERFFSETILRLPLSYLTFEVSHPTPPVVPSPCAASGVFTCGSLVAQYKITPPVLDAWAEILQQAPGSQLLLANTTLKSSQNREYVKERFAERGIAAERLRLFGPAEHYRYLQYYDQIDLALDAFPYNGGTTTMEALWQGVPVLTFDGDRWASRTSQTLIRRGPCPEFAVENLDEYIMRAVAIANSAESQQQLSELRRSLRERLAASSACDAPRLAAAMEGLYDQLCNK
jgi:predicted O-linked N-acetylglucosamine transferase (SPINDLY family)